MTRTFASLSAVALLALGACAQTSAVDPTRPAGQGGVVEKVVYVASEVRPCTAGVARTTCLQVRETESAPWELHYFGYEGFEHKPGVEYRLRVRGTPVANPPGRRVFDPLVADRNPRPEARSVLIRFPHAPLLTSRGP